MTFFRLSKATLLAAAALLIAVAQPAAAQKLTLRISSESPQTTLTVQMNEVFKSALIERLGDAVAVDTFHSGALGGEQVHLDMVRGGQIDVYGIGADIMAMEDKAAFFEMPFLIRDMDAAQRLLASPEIQEEFFASFRKKTGLQPLVMVTNGFRHFSSSNAPIVVPDDVKGMKMRVPNSSLRMRTWRHYGASPVTISSGELYVALANKTADGQEQSLVSIAARSLWEVQSYLSLSNYLFGPHMLTMNGAKYDSLTEEQKKAVHEAADEAAKFLWVEEAKLREATLKVVEKSMKINEVDYEAWKNISMPLWEEIMEASPEKEFLRKIVDIATSN